MLLKNNFVTDTHTENAPTNETQAFTKNMNIDIWVFPTLNQLFIKGSFTEVLLDFRFPENCIKVKVMKMIKIFSDRHLKYVNV